MMESDDTEPKPIIYANAIETKRGDIEAQPEEDYFESFVVSNESVRGSPSSLRPLLFPDYRKTVFKCIPQEFKLRYWALKLTTWPWFEKISLLVVIVNCVTMGMHKPCENACDTFWCHFLENIDDFIYVFFLFEMLIKIFAMGLIGKKAYLSDTWNRLDCFIVVAGATDYMSLGENTGITAIRTIRVLRPLRAINKAPSMRILVTLIIDTIPMLSNVCALAVLVFIVFGIIGVQLWKGMLRNRCYSILDYTFNSTTNRTTYNSFYMPEDDDFICSTTPNGMQTCADVPLFINDSASFSLCQASEFNPFKNSISFDNIGYAFIVIFQIVTLESWITIMYHVQDAHTEYAWIYFVLVIVIGSFFLLNMVLVVISVQFSETKAREEKLIAKEKREEWLAHSHSTNSTFVDMVEKNWWEEFLLFLARMAVKPFEMLCGAQYNLNNQQRHLQQLINPESCRHTTTLQIFFCCYQSLSETLVFKKIFNLRDKVRVIVDSQWFQHSILAAILVNSIFMGIEYHEQPELLTKIGEISNYIFTVVFFIEMLLKVFGFGLFGYLKEPLNLFDAAIVAVSVFEIFSDADSSGLSVLRTFRLLRLIKLFRFITTLKRQIVVMVKTLDSVATFCCLVLLFLFIFSTLGMHLFGCKFYELDEEGNKVHDRKNFNNLYWSMITVFQILTQEDWNEVMYLGMEKTGPFASIYFILLMVFGNYVLFSLLVAILVEGFSEVDGELKQNIDVIQEASSKASKSMKSADEIEMREINKIEEEPEPTSELLQESEVVDEIKYTVTKPDTKKESDYSLYIFSRSSKYRKWCIDITSQSWFGNMIFFVIFLNCIALAIENPSISPTSCDRKNLNFANYCFTFIFTVEAILKIVANNFIFGKKAYLKDGWNIIDFFLVLASLADLIISVLAKNNMRVLSLLKILRIMRTLRPLRAINNAPGLKLVVTSLLSSLKPIGNTVLITCSFFIIFAILGVQLFKGKLYFCEGLDMSNVTTKADCLANPANKWVNSMYNYDNILNALFTLFIVATLDGWVDAMYQGIDAVGVDMQPQMNHNEYMAFFFLIYLLFMGFFVVNMFVGVIIDNFHKCCEEQEKIEAVRKEEKKRIGLEKACQSISEPPYYLNYSRFRKGLHDIVMSAYFDLAITACILLNILMMTFEYYMMPQYLVDILEYFNYAFTLIFLIEAILRVYVLGPRQYVKDSWNLLDLFIVIVSVASIFIHKFVDIDQLPVDPTLIRVIRIIRIARVLKLLKSAKGIQSLLNTVGDSLLQVGNLALLFGLFFFIFATLGVEIFGKLTCDSRLGECTGINKHTNFNTFGSAFLTLFRITTGDNWSSIMKDCLQNNIVCVQHYNSSRGLVEIHSDIEPQSWCLYSIITPAYFIFFVLSAQFILMNLVIAVLMKELEEANEEAAEEEQEELEKAMQRQTIADANKSLASIDAIIRI